MARKKGKTSDAELQDAIERIGKKREASRNARDTGTWQNFLVNTLGVRLASVKSDKGEAFWENVRLGIAEKEKEAFVPPQKEPTSKRPFYFPVYRDKQGRFTNDKTAGVGKVVEVYRDEKGRFRKK